jgi:hypothetical protein
MWETQRGGTAPNAKGGEHLSRIYNVKFHAAEIRAGPMDTTLQFTLLTAAHYG